MRLQLQLCVSTSSWSDGFSLDTVGSSGCVRCPSNNMDYLVTETLTSFRASDLSHIVFMCRRSRSKIKLPADENSVMWSKAPRSKKILECVPLCSNQLILNCACVYPGGCEHPDEQF